MYSTLAPQSVIYGGPEGPCPLPIKSHDLILASARK